MSTTFSHVVGTLAVLAITLSIVAAFTGLVSYLTIEARRIQLKEIVEAVGRSMVEIISVHSIGGGNISIMRLKLPQHIEGIRYIITARNIGNESAVVELTGILANLGYTKTVVLPNFGEGVVKVVEQNMTLTCGVNTYLVTNVLSLPSRGYAHLVVIRGVDYMYVGFISQNISEEDIVKIIKGECNIGV